MLRRDEKDQLAHLCIVPTDGSAKPRRLTFSKSAESGVAWGPDSRQIAFSAKQRGSSHRFTRINTDQSSGLPLLDAFMRLYYYARSSSTQLNNSGGTPHAWQDHLALSHYVAARRRRGFRDPIWTRQDPDLALLHSVPEFERLYPPPN
jgi:hypothetical protein